MTQIMVHHVQIQKDEVDIKQVITSVAIRVNITNLVDKAL